MRKSSRDAILTAALDLLRRQEAISLDSVAVAAGLSKPGLMYHFKTKEALMLGVVDRVADEQKAELDALLDDVDPASPWPRLTAYVRWMLSGTVDEADLAMMADPKLRDTLMQRWSEHFAPWVALPDGLDDATRTRLEGARFMAEGVWFADASGVLAIADDARPGVRALAETLIAPGTTQGMAENEPTKNGSNQNSPKEGR